MPVPPRRCMLLDDFLKEPTRFVRGNAFLQRAAPTGSSSQIVGIMQAIADDFVQDLQKEQSEEATNQKSFEALMAAKATESKVLEQQILAKTEEKADSKSSLEATKKEHTFGGHQGYNGLAGGRCEVPRDRGQALRFQRREVPGAQQDPRCRDGCSF
ncbi:unnamed protein product [Symbiodinium natans]|uniref:Uncharacterized protein n=1 Tax=Symbiodinium natans TaxID=878477 RepID=A0A812QJE4_9DINO|nr:unnamed protein product [Symbiodinium natans]